MKYVGSKARLAKDIAPILQSAIDNWGGQCQGYIEPFVGGANLIQHIDCPTRIGSDNNKYLIELLKHVRDNPQDLPTTYDEDEYNRVKSNPLACPDWYVGLVGFSTFGAKWFGGFPRGFKNDGVTPRDIVAESIRNLKKQSSRLQGIDFQCKDFREITELKNYVVYCDIPYRNSLQYSKDKFPYEEFYSWCRETAAHNKVFISEYAMPDDFMRIWEKQIRCPIDRVARTNRIEKLFTINS